MRRTAKRKKGKEMKEVELSVSIISHTEKPLETIYKAARQCYSRDSVPDMESVSQENMAELVQRCIRSGHTSVLEHASFTFVISGVSRALSHQLVRHRMASYSQQSQRYVKAGELEYVCPPSLYESLSAERSYFLASLTAAECAYRDMIAAGVPAEDARFVLPQACATNVVMTMNCRELLHFMEERCCRKAQWEIRTLAWGIREKLVDVIPEVFVGHGPKCRRLGYCPEEESCGEYPKREE